MPIPKVIYQTFKSERLPLVARWHIYNFKKRNRNYKYEFYDDARIEEFFLKEYGPEILKLYCKIQIGAAKADMFRYAVLLKFGGVYLDIDSNITGRLDDFILPEDAAIISREKNPDMFVQWALIYEANHPFLEHTFECVLENIKLNKYPYDVHCMTGPTVYSRAIEECLKKDPTISHRVLGIDYEGHLKFKYSFSKILYAEGEHWKKKQMKTPVLKL